MRVKLAATFLFVVFLTGTLFALNRDRKIEPATDARATLTRSLYNQTVNMDPPMKKLVYIAYISGFVDAMQLNYMDNAAAKKFIADCKDLTFGDLIDSMLNFKEENSQWRDIVPAEMLTVVVPRLKKSLSPFPEEAEHLE